MSWPHDIHAVHYAEKALVLRDDIRKVYAEGKTTGFDLNIMRQAIWLKRMEKAGRSQQETLLDVYRRAIGMDSEIDAAERRTLPGATPTSATCGKQTSPTSRSSVGCPSHLSHLP